MVNMSIVKMTVVLVGVTTVSLLLQVKLLTVIRPEGLSFFFLKLMSMSIYAPCEMTNTIDPQPYDKEEYFVTYFSMGVFPSF